MDNTDDIYILKDCLFVLKDKDSLIKVLRSLSFDNNSKYDVIKGISKTRDTINTMQGFLYTIDSDFRTNLYKSHIDLIKTGLLPPQCLLSRSKFSMNNIHRNIGNISYYSTYTNKKNENEIKYYNRQELFQENYNNIKEILNNNPFRDSRINQEEIELFLHNQENQFFDSKDFKTNINYDEQVLKILEEKNSDLRKLLSYPDEDITSIKILGNQYINYYKKIIDKLGVVKVSSLLLSFFMEIVSKECDIKNDKVFSIQSLACYERFGKKIFNKFLFKEYTDYIKLNKKKDLSFYEYLEICKNKYEVIYNDNNSFTLIGGYFV